MNAWTVMFWIVAVVLLFATWRLWRAAVREWRYTTRVKTRIARAREDVLWGRYRRQEYLQALKLAMRNGDLEASAVLFEESIRHATRNYARLAAALRAPASEISFKQRKRLAALREKIKHGEWDAITTAHQPMVLVEAQDLLDLMDPL